MRQRSPRLAVLISGGGTTLVNLHDKIRDHELQAEIVVVIASRSGIVFQIGRPSSPSQIVFEARMNAAT